MSSVLFASHTAESSVFHVGSHHLAREVARAGHRAGHLSTPLSPVKVIGLGNRNGLLARWRDWARGPRSTAERQFAAVPFTLLPLQNFALTGRAAALRSAVPGVRSTVARMGLLPLDYLVIDQPLFATLPDLLPARRIVYRPTDIYRSPALRRAEEHLLTRVDGVIATSSAVLENLPTTAREVPELVLPNGVEFEHFAHAGPGPGDAPHDAPDHPGAVYVGALDDRVDWSWLSRLAEELAPLPLDLVGPPPAASPALPPNVRFRGAVDYLQLPQLLSRYRVALLPFLQTPENLGRSPMKLYEYLASGLVVVGTGHFAARGGQVPGVVDAPDPVRAAVAVRDGSAAGARNPDGRAAAARQDWSVRARDLMEFLERL